MVGIYRATGYLKGVFMKNGIILSLILLPAAVLCSCKTESGGPIDTSDPQSEAPDDPVTLDSALWFSGMYEKLAADSSAVKTRREVCDAINAKISNPTLSPPAGTGTDPADCAFLLQMIDKANEVNSNNTSYHLSEYAAAVPVKQDTLNAALSFIFDKKFVALSTAYGINGAASQDGETWAPVSTGRSGSWQGIAVGKEKFVALAASTGKRAVYSANGINWEWTSMPFDASWQDLAFGGSVRTDPGDPAKTGRFAAVASYSNRAAYSDDGITWTETEMPGGASWRSVAYGNGRFTAIATNGSNTAAWSSDGVIWNTAELPAALDWSAVAYGNGKFAAVALKSARAAYSNDGGATWTLTDISAANADWQDVTFGGPGGIGVFVALAAGKAAYSGDGENWTEVTANLDGENWHSVTYGNGKFVALASGSDKTASSSDGVNWTLSAMPGRANWQHLAWGP
jgi:hypothetical protein